MTVLQTLVTVKQPQLTSQYLYSTYVTVLHQRTTESQPYVHCGPLLTVVRNQRMLTVLKPEANIKKFWKQLQESQGNGRFATYSQGRIQTSDGDPRTGTFHQTLVTACDANGALENYWAFKIGSYVLNPSEC